jgi:hypothetical protein
MKGVGGPQNRYDGRYKEKIHLLPQPEIETKFIRRPATFKYNVAQF